MESKDSEAEVRDFGAVAAVAGQTSLAELARAGEPRVDEVRAYATPGSWTPAGWGMRRSPRTSCCRLDL